MRRKVDRPGVRHGYDRWSSSYDRSPNPLVALDRRHTLEPVGLDPSHGMLRATRRKFPEIPLAQADLNDPLPVRAKSLDRPLLLTVEASKP